VTNQRLVIKAL